MPLLALLWLAVLHALASAPPARLQPAAADGAVAPATRGARAATPASAPMRAASHEVAAGATSALRRSTPVGADQALHVARWRAGCSPARREGSWDHGAGHGTPRAEPGLAEPTGLSAATRARPRGPRRVVVSDTEAPVHYATPPPRRG